LQGQGQDYDDQMAVQNTKLTKATIIFTQNGRIKKSVHNPLLQLSLSSLNPRGLLNHLFIAPAVQIPYDVMREEGKEQGKGGESGRGRGRG
jgi:hypothetical protein